MKSSGRPSAVVREADGAVVEAIEPIGSADPEIPVGSGGEGKNYVAGDSPSRTV